MASPDDYLLMSGIQHFSFCRRQWALIHLEQQWSENQRTAEVLLAAGVILAGRRSPQGERG